MIVKEGRQGVWECGREAGRKTKEGRGEGVEEEVGGGGGGEEALLPAQ